ncbi:hypothetical protein BDN70DRAFT_820720, partial [Pholiota conissans]
MKPGLPLSGKRQLDRSLRSPVTKNTPLARQLNQPHVFPGGPRFNNFNSNTRPFNSSRPAQSNGKNIVPLSEKERADLLAAGKCFYCKEAGHMARNCPKRSSLKSGTNRPPGLSTFSIGQDKLGADTGDSEVEYIDDESIDKLRANSIEFIPSHFRLIDLAERERWSLPEPLSPPKSHLGNALELGAQHCLEWNAPYPGDAPTNWFDPMRPFYRFAVVEGEGDRYNIIDLHYYRSISIPGFLLRHPNFRLTEWYAAQLA